MKKFFCCLILSALWVGQVTAQPALSGKISGGFQAPTSTDSDGRRHVIKGKDMETRGNNLLELTEPRVTRYNPDDSPDMYIESAHCFYQTKAGVAYSRTNLIVRTADSRFAIEGLGWHWDLSASLLTISNEVAAVVQKAALATLSTTASSSTSPRTEGKVRINSERFRLEGDAASFIGNVTVRDGEDILRCEQLNIQFVKPGGAQKIEALRNVNLTQGSARIQSGEAVYDVKNNTIRISQNPRWSSELREGSADVMVMDRNRDVLVAEGSVYMKFPLTNVLALTENSTEAPPSTNRFMEIRSDTFEFQNARSNRMAEAVYLGQVKATQGEASLACEKLTASFSSSNRLSRIFAEREVKIESGKNRVFGREADYDFTNEKIVLRGDPHWEVDATRGRSETLVFLPKTRELLALKNVELLIPGRSLGTLIATGAPTKEVVRTNAEGVQTNDEVIQTNAPLKITAESLSHSGDVSVFQNNVRVVDARGTMECRLMTLFSGSSNQVQRIVAEENVVIRQPDLVALGERAVYEQATGLVRLTGNPELLAPEKSLRAEAFVIDRNRNTFSVSPGRYRIQLSVSRELQRKFEANDKR